MYRIDNASSVSAKPAVPAAGTPGYFSNGNPATAQEATIVEDWWCNQIQDEILTVITQAGLAPAKNDTTQLYQALNLLYQGAGDIGSTYLTIVNYQQWQAPKLTAGSATAYTATYSIPPGALADGMTHLIEFHIANGALATLNVNALGAHPIHYFSCDAWRPIPPALLGLHAQHRVSYNAATAAYRLTGWKDTTGDLVPTGRTTARSGTINGLGQAVDRNQYAGLFAAYGTTYGAGNGSTTFNLPDLRGRMIAGTDQGVGRIGAIVAGTLGSVGGAEQMSYTVTATSASVQVTGTADVTGTAATAGKAVTVSGTTDPEGGYGWASGSNYQLTTHPHTHTFTGAGTVTANSNVTASGPITAWTTGGGAVNGTTDTKGNMPPTFVANYAICL
jgi:microcystin-dependent protein